MQQRCLPQLHVHFITVSLSLPEPNTRTSISVDEAPPPSLLNDQPLVYPPSTRFPFTHRHDIHTLSSDGAVNIRVEYEPWWVERWRERVCRPQTQDGSRGLSWARGRRSASSSPNCPFTISVLCRHCRACLRKNLCCLVICRLVMFTLSCSICSCRRTNTCKNKSLSFMNFGWTAWFFAATFNPLLIIFFYFLLLPFIYLCLSFEYLCLVSIFNNVCFNVLFPCVALNITF